MATLEAQALAAADEIIAEQGANVVTQSRLVLSLAWMQGYGHGLDTMHRISQEALEAVERQLAS